jgi:superfamily II DNA helicase RecQ
MAGRNAHGLTVVISPLQSLMKDQVDNLAGKGITSSVTVNGLLSPLERKEALERVEDGSTALLYISPEKGYGSPVFLSTLAVMPIFSAHGGDFPAEQHKRYYIFTE